MKPAEVILTLVLLVGAVAVLVILLRSPLVAPSSHVSLIPDTAAPVAAQLAAAERTEVDVDRPTETECLRAKILVLESKLHQFEMVIPSNSAELAVALGKKESDIAALLERSEMLPNARTLREALTAAGTASTGSALEAERDLYIRLAEFHANNPNPDHRQEWHDYQFVPFYEKQIAIICDRLYTLGLPSTIVEPFRSRLNEGI